MLNDIIIYLDLFPWLGYLITGIFGLVFGSFLTFLFYRIRAGEAWLWGKQAKRSKCPSCGHVLGVRDLIPVLSWVCAKGCCRYCQAPVSIRYPLIEITTAFIFIAVYYLSRQ